jgi:hypothetical protein
MSVAQQERPSVEQLLPVENPELWPQRGHEVSFSLSRKDYEPLQLEVLRRRFDQLKDSVEALDRLAKRQGVTRVDSIADALPLFFDHRVLKNYPVSIIETRDFPKLTAWLNRLTTVDLTKMDLGGLKTLDDWMTRLDDFGMIIGHSTGTTGKLSFVPLAQREWPAWEASYNACFHATTGVDPRHDPVPTFIPTYRGGHQMMLKIFTLFHVPSAGGWENYHTLYQTRLSSDLLALAGRLQSAEDRGELAQLGLDPALIELRQEMIAQGRRRDADIQVWFEKLMNEFRGRRVKIGGTFSDLTRVAVQGLAKGQKCAFAPGSFILSGGGMKGYKDAPENWRDVIKEFFGIGRIGSTYGMSECMGLSPQCVCGNYHVPPYVIPVLVDRDVNALPRAGVQTGRLALFDLLAETHWGGFISGDQVTIHWDEDCACGWKGPYIEDNIARFAEMEGGDDKITCAGSQAAYNEFMDFMMNV